MVEGSTSMRIFSSMVTETPMRPSSSIMVVTSCKCGRCETVTGPAASRQPARIGSVAFLAPEMRISPSSAMPPCICSLSTALPCVLVRRKYLQRQSRSRVAHRRAERGVHHLMPLYGLLADERRRDHHGLEMHVVLAAHQRMAAAQSGLDQLCHLLWIHAVSSKFTQAYLYYSQMNPDYTDEGLVELGRQALNVEIEGLRAQLPRLGTDFARACRICLDCRGRVVVTGMGKSGHIGGKIAATLASTGPPAFFMHPGGGGHGHGGMITRGDAGPPLANSGATA